MEMSQHAPDVLDFLVTIAVPQMKRDSEQQIPPLRTAYGILMNSRWRELSLIQKVNGILLGFGNATERVIISILLKGLSLLLLLFTIILLVKRLFDC